MKKNLAVLLVVFGLATFTAVFGAMPSTWGMFFKSFAVCSIFWALMLAPAFGNE